jgi:hypothetical protein
LWTFNGTFGDYTVGVIVHDSAPGVDPSTHGQTISQATFTLHATNAAAGALKIRLEDPSFTNFFPGMTRTLSNSLSTTLVGGGSVSAFGFIVDPTIAANTTGTSTLSAGGFDLKTKGVTLPGTGTYDLGDIATVSGLGLGLADNFTVTTILSVPEPTSMVLFGIGAVGAMGYSWRRRKLLA